MVAKVGLTTLAGGSLLSYVIAFEHALGSPWWTEPLAGLATVLVCAWVLAAVKW